MKKYSITAKGKQRESPGFTLVEMAVALAAIAALVVLAMGGNELLKKAKVGSIIKDIKRFSEATTSFEEKYHALPGDLVDISSIPGLTSADAGNGNGTVDQAEALLFWRQLTASNLLDGAYDGASTYVLGVGVPKAPMEGGGYYVFDASQDRTISSQAIVIGLGGFSTSGSPTHTLGVLSPKAAKAIDDAMDDGKPTTGNVRSRNGDSGNCLTVSAYNLKNTHTDCIMQFVLRSQQAINTDQAALSGVCSQAGQTRESPDPTQRCPVGYVGKIIEACHIDTEDATGSWEISRSVCEQVTCSDKKPYGNRRILSCMNGQTGAGIVEECSQYGTWLERDDLSDCSTPTGVAGGASCNTLNEARLPQACSWGRIGKVLQTCKLPDGETTNYWTTDSGGNQCALVTCSGGVLGDVRPKTDTSCGDYYLGVDADQQQYAVSEACTMDGTWQVVANECSPQYGSCNASTDSTRDVGCPPGERGEHIQTCINNGEQDYWVTVEDSCEPVTCSGEKVGSVRILSNTPCSNGRAGTMMEVCHDDGLWYSTAANCTQTVCSGAGNTDGNANWPNANAGTASVTATSCTSLYRKSVYPGGALPTRSCNSSGQWGSVTNECVRITCAAGVSDHAFYPATNQATTDSGTDDIQGTCLFGYQNATEGAPTKQCSPTGTVDEAGGGVWEVPKNLCVEDNFTGIPQANLIFWFDADEASSIVKNTDCAAESPGPDQQAGNGDPVTCWYDKGIYRMKLIAPEGEYPTYRTNAQNGRPALTFEGAESLTLLDYADIPPDDGTGDTFVLVALREDIPGDGPNYIFSKEFPAGVEDSLFFTNSGAASLAFERSDVQKISTNNAGFDADRFYMYTLITHSDGTADWYINGALSYTAGENTDISTGGSGPTYVLGGRVVNGERYRGEIAESIMYNSALGSTERSQIHNYLSSKWGISLTNTPPGEVTKGLSLWLDSQDENALYVDNGCTTSASLHTPIRCWKDKSMHHREATDADSDPPVYEIPDDIDHPIAQFSDNRLSLPQVLSIDETDFSMFAVYAIRGDHGDYRAFLSPVLSQPTSSSGYRYIMGNKGDLIELDRFPPTGNSSLSTDTIPFEQLMLLSWHAGGGKDNLYYQGHLAMDEDSINSHAYGGGGSDQRVMVGGTGAQSYIGDIGEVLLYNREVSGAERSAIESALMTKWGLGEVTDCIADNSLTVTEGLQLWYDAKDTDCDGNAGNEPAPNSPLATWKDKSTHERDATAAEAALYTAIGMGGGLPGLQFEDSHYDIPAFNMGDAFSLAFVFKTNEVSEGYLWESDPLGLAPAVAHPLIKSSAFAIQGLLQAPPTATDGLVTGAFNDSEPTIAIYTYQSGGEAFLYRNGEEMGSSTDTAMSANGSQTYDLGGSNYNGYMGEVMAYDRVLTTENREALQDYLSAKWSIDLVAETEVACVTDASLPSNTRLKLWLDASDIDCDGDAEDDPDDNTEILRWRDKKNMEGINAYDALGVEGAGPIYRTNIQNGRPVLRFDAAHSEYLQVGAVDAILDPASLSFFVVFNPTDDVGRTLLWVPSETADLIPRLWTFEGSFHGAEHYIGGLLGPEQELNESSHAATEDNFHIGTYQVRDNGHAGIVYVDGQAGEVGALGFPFGASWLTHMRIGGNNEGRPFFSGDIAEILIYGDFLTEETREEVQTYLGTKWGIALP